MSRNAKKNLYLRILNINRISYYAVKIIICKFIILQQFASLILNFAVIYRKIKAPLS